MFSVGMNPGELLALVVGSLVLLQSVNVGAKAGRDRIPEPRQGVVAKNDVQVPWLEPLTIERPVLRWPWASELVVRGSALVGKVVLYLSQRSRVKDGSLVLDADVLLVGGRALDAGVDLGVVCWRDDGSIMVTLVVVGNCADRACIGRSLATPEQRAHEEVVPANGVVLPDDLAPHVRHVEDGRKKTDDCCCAENGGGRGAWCQLVEVETWRTLCNDDGGENGRHDEEVERAGKRGNLGWILAVENEVLGQQEDD